MVVIGERVAVIEPGTPHADEQARLFQELDALAASGRSLAAILLTHHHGDHVGAAQPLRARTGAPIVAHAETAARLPFAVDRTLADGETLTLGPRAVLQAVFTPGHAPGHLVYLERESGIAYAGDMIAGEGTILIDPFDGGDMAQYLASLQRVAGLGARALVPAHGPVQHDPAAVIARYVAHRLAREAAVLGALHDGPQPPAVVLARAYADTPQMLWPLAERSLEAHLRKLVAEGRVRRDGESIAAVAS
ncbi:MAG: MBL fold metallo-hydrolase [Nannocystaceae bacterium]|nr:MBL fold metallo-hydrolase [Nannocystaceae bacterium]